MVYASLQSQTKTRPWQSCRERILITHMGGTPKPSILEESRIIAWVRKAKGWIYGLFITLLYKIYVVAKTCFFWAEDVAQWEDVCPVRRRPKVDFVISQKGRKERKKEEKRWRRERKVRGRKKEMEERKGIKKVLILLHFLKLRSGTFLLN